MTGLYTLLKMLRPGWAPSDSANSPAPVPQSSPELCSAMANAMKSATRSAAPFSGCNASLRPQIAVARSRRTVCQPQNAIKEIFMPALSSTMTEGKIVSWLKSPGDKITKGESVVVVESDKADMDVESFSEGFLGGIVIEEGGMANVGAPQIIGNLAPPDPSIL